MAEKYFIVGGRYKDTDFKEMAEGETYARLGPFKSYDEAVAVWRAKAMETVDEAYVRYNIEVADHKEYWVIGGIYTDTDFAEIANGREEERHGPYGTIEEARARWKEKAMASVDNCYARFRIDKL